MIKQTAYTLLIAIGITASVSACKDTDPLINAANNEKMRAELKETYPSLNNAQIRIEVKDFQDITVILGDKQLYSKTDEQLQEVTQVIAEMTYKIYNENNYLDEGKVIYHEKERKVLTDSDPKKEFDMHLEQFKEK